MATEIKLIDQKVKFHYQDGGVIKDIDKIRSCCLVDLQSFNDLSHNS